MSICFFAIRFRPLEHHARLSLFRARFKHGARRTNILPLPLGTVPPLQYSLGRSLGLSCSLIASVSLPPETKVVSSRFERIALQSPLGRADGSTFPHKLSLHIMNGLHGSAPVKATRHGPWPLFMFILCFVLFFPHLILGETSCDWLKTHNAMVLCFIDFGYRLHATYFTFRKFPLLSTLQPSFPTSDSPRMWNREGHLSGERRKRRFIDFALEVSRGTVSTLQRY